MCDQCQQQRDDVKWLALLIRQGLKIIVVEIEKKYGLRETTQAEERNRKHRAA